MFDQTEFLSFDCYGTLIDWESGILGALRPMLEREGVEVDDNSLLETFAELEAEAEAGPYVTYREVLAQVVDGLARRYNFEATEADRDSIAESVKAWPAFPDSRAALSRLRSRFKLAVLSNVDDDLFEASARKLGEPFYFIFTAQQLRSYKPSIANFEYMIDELGGDAAKIVHVAQSLFHDILPANRLGLRTVWINRRAGVEGPGATPPAEATPDLVFPTLRAFADAFD